MKTYEVFLRKDGKDEFRHAGSMQAPDGEMAVPLAREAYARRGEGDHLWLVERSDILAAGPDLMSVNASKTHRHNDGKVVAETRKARRTAGGAE